MHVEEERRGVVGHTDASSQAPSSSVLSVGTHDRFRQPRVWLAHRSLVPEPLVRCPRQSINNTKRVGGRDVGKAELARTTREWITERARALPDRWLLLAS